MPNINAPYGFAPVCYRNGNPWNGMTRMYAIASGDANAFYTGDPVKIVANADANGLPIVTLGTAGSPLRGVALSFATAVQGGFLQGGPFINPSNLALNYRPANTTGVMYCAVVDDPDVVFSIMEGTGTPGTAANISGKNANFVYGAPASGVYVSGVTLDTTTYATTATLNCRLMGAVQDYQNTPFTAFQRLLVTLNSHDFSGGTAGT